MIKKTLRSLISFIILLCIILSFNSVSYAAGQGSRGYCNYYGFSYESYISYLKSHENDKYYLTTPYHNKDWRSPNGDTSFNGSAGMNCNGFVWHVLQAVIKKNGGNPKNYDIQNYSNPKGWMRILQDNNIKYYIFNNKWEALKSGVMSKGDIIYMFENSNLYPSSHNHTGIYWGDGKSDVFWHSAGKCNQISKIWSGGDVVKFVVAKMCINGNINITCKDDAGNKISGTKFSIYNSSGSLYKTVNGNTTVGNIPFGTYTVKQTGATNGYEKSNETKKVTISLNKTTNTVSFVNKRQYGAVSVSVRRGQYFPSIGKMKYYPLTECIINVYSDSDCNNYVDSIKTNTNGVATYGYNGGKYSLLNGCTYYFRIAENQDDLSHYILDYNYTLSATVKINTITQCSKSFDLLKKSAVKISGYEYNTEFIILNSENLGDNLNIFCTDSTGKTVYDSYTDTDENGTAYIGYNSDKIGDTAYLLDKCSVYVYSIEEDILKKLNTEYGCVTDFKTGKPTVETFYGDVDFSNSITLIDAKKSLRFLAKLESYTQEELARIDFNGNGKIDTKEVRSVLRYIAKLQNTVN